MASRRMAQAQALLPGSRSCLPPFHSMTVCFWHIKVEEVLERLRAASAPRARLRDLRRLAAHGPGSAPIPLAAQVAARAAARAPTPDLAHNTASLRRAPPRLPQVSLPGCWTGMQAGSEHGNRCITAWSGQSPCTGGCRRVFVCRWIRPDLHVWI